jgi:hypothetical protein
MTEREAEGTFDQRSEGHRGVETIKMCEDFGFDVYMYGMMERRVSHVMPCHVN